MNAKKFTLWWFLIFFLLYDKIPLLWFSLLIEQWLLSQIVTKYALFPSNNIYILVIIFVNWTMSTVTNAKKYSIWLVFLFYDIISIIMIIYMLIEQLILSQMPKINIMWWLFSRLLTSYMHFTDGMNGIFEIQLIVKKTDNFSNTADCLKNWYFKYCWFLNYCYLFKCCFFFFFLFAANFSNTCDFFLIAANFSNTGDFSHTVIFQIVKQKVTFFGRLALDHNVLRAYFLWMIEICFQQGFGMTGLQ